MPSPPSVEADPSVTSAIDTASIDIGITVTDRTSVPSPLQAMSIA